VFEGCTFVEWCLEWDSVSSMYLVQSTVFGSDNIFSREASKFVLTL
jgi:hypothetical protein